MRSQFASGVARLNFRRLCGYLIVWGGNCPIGDRIRSFFVFRIMLVSNLVLDVLLQCLDDRRVCCLRLFQQQAQSDDLPWGVRT